MVKGSVCTESGAGVVRVLTSAFVFTATGVGGHDDCRGEFLQRTGLRNASLAVFLASPSQSVFSPYRTFKNIGTNLRTLPFQPANAHMGPGAMEELGPSAFLSVSAQLQLDQTLPAAVTAETALKGRGWSGQQGGGVLGREPCFVLCRGHLTSAY